MQSPYNALVEDYTEVFYTIHKGDVPCVQCMDFGWSKSLREVDRTNFILTDSNVPKLTPSLNSIKTALQLSENINLFALSHI
jgi:hypothetical protein